MKLSKKKLSFSSLLCTALLFSAFASAGTVDTVKGGYVLFHEELPIHLHDRYMTIDAQGHATGFLEVRRTNGTRAVAAVKSGTPQVGDETHLMEEEEKPAPDRFQWPEQSWTVGLTGERALVNLEVAPAQPAGLPTSLQTRGPAFGVAVGGDFKATPWLAFDTAFGYRSISTNSEASTGICSSSRDCTFRVGYLNLYGGARIYPFNFKKARPYLSLGFDLGLPVDRESTAVEINTINLAVFYRAGIGAQIYLFPEHYLNAGITYSGLTSAGPRKISLFGMQLEHGWEF